MNDKSKLIFTVPGLSADSAARVRSLLGARFPQFRFEGSMGSIPPSVRAVATGRHDFFAVGPWHLSGRERPALDSMRMFGEGAAAALASSDESSSAPVVREPWQDHVDAALDQEQP